MPKVYFTAENAEKKEKGKRIKGKGKTKKGNA